jgi:hypothetical protein
MSKDIPGDSRASALAYQQQMVRLAQQIVRFEQVLERMFDEDEEILGLSVRIPSTEGADYLITVRARIGEKRKVAFHASYSFADTIRGLVARLENRSMRWKEDQYGDK